MLEIRLEYLSDSAATLADYEAGFFVDNLSFALLKTADLYKTDEIVKWYVDCGEKLGKSISSIFSAGNFAFHMTMLAGDIGFGTSDTFNRYQEMNTISDIASAIVEANRKINIPQKIENDSVLTDIQTKCNYYKMLISTHARGEYLVYQLLINDAGLLSDFRVLSEYFKEPEETTDSWYSGQINCMSEYYDILEKMFEISDIEKNIPEAHADSSYTWILSPTIEADDIYYLANYPNLDHPINTVSKQANNPNAVIQRGEQLGIINLEGKLLADVEYKEIANFCDNYMMVRTIPKYSEEFDMDWEIYWLNQEGKVSADVGNGSFDSALYYYFEGVRQQTGCSSDSYIQEVIPVQESSICNPHDVKLVMDNLSGKYALEQNGKWGYIDKNGQVIIPIEYDASWSQYPVFDMSSERSSNNVKEYCYAASDGYIVLCKDNQWELKDITGNSIIPKGIFEAIRPVYNGKCWVKKDRKWGVIQVGEPDPQTHSETIYEKEKKNVESIKEKTIELQERLQNSYLTQAEMNQISAQLYKSWDDEINRLWKVLTENIDSDVMDSITQEQIQWINEKEKALEDIGSKVDGGSMESLSRNAKGADLTCKRVYELLEYLKVLK